MVEVEEQAVSDFGNYLGALADDTEAILDAVVDPSLDGGVRRVLAGALNYLFKSLDLIDDGIEGLGYLDDAFVIRIACAQAQAIGPLPQSLSPLAEQAQHIAAFVGDLTPRFDRFVGGLKTATVRGRSVEAIVSDATVLEELTLDVRSWAARYKKPQFVLDERGLIKLRAFLGAKLPH